MTDRFATYGFLLEVPEDWRVEFSPKNTREKGDVAFHSPGRNVFFVSWGRLEDAKKRYGSLELQRDESVRRFRRDPNMQKADIVSSSRGTVMSHEAVLTKVVAQRRRGMLARVQPNHDVWSAHFYCPQMGRYYVAYWHISNPQEYPEAEANFAAIVGSMACHPEPQAPGKVNL